jgi:hypothetical protein
MFVSGARADALFGKCTHKDGSKAGNSNTISTSWNSKKAYPKNGNYTLDFGGKVDKTITVYCNGTKVGTVYVSGSTRFNIIVP